MASQEQVKEYLAHWFQLGKPIVLANGKAECLPYPIFHGYRYSQAFEECWQQIMSNDGEGCYLKGTHETIAMMLTAAWDVHPCARCRMPIVVPTLGLNDNPCPCNDLKTWPNTDMPMPRSQVSDAEHLDQLRQRLNQVKGRESIEGRGTYDLPADAANIFSSWRGTS